MLRFISIRSTHRSLRGYLLIAFILFATLIISCRSPQIGENITINITVDGQTYAIDVIAGSTVSQALQTAGITTFGQLGKSKPAKLEKILLEAGLRKPASLETWSEQAVLLAKGDEVGFATLTTDLTAGRKKSR